MGEHVMKSLLSAIENRDSKKLSSLVQPINKPVEINEHAGKFVDMLFDNLVQIFPAAKHTVFSNQDDISATKRQWVLVFSILLGPATFFMNRREQRKRTRLFEELVSKTDPQNPSATARKAAELMAKAPKDI